MTLPVTACYLALVLSVYDGDTIRADIQLGFSTVRANESIRIVGIDAPEVRGDEREAGLVARDALRALILDQTVAVCPEGRDKYGRTLAEIVTEDIPSISQWMIENGYAESYL